MFLIRTWKLQILKLNVNMSPNVDKMEEQKKVPTINNVVFIKLLSAGTEGRCYLHSHYLPGYPRQYEAPIPISSPPQFYHSYFTLGNWETYMEYVAWKILVNFVAGHFLPVHC
jgi:hypothetical protein